MAWRWTGDNQAEPKLAYCQLDSWEQISVKFESEFYHFHSRKLIWKCCLPKWWPFCPGGHDLTHLLHGQNGCQTKPGPIFCLLLRVSSDCAQPITGQVTEVTCPVIGWAQPELTPSKRQKQAQKKEVSQIQQLWILITADTCVKREPMAG